MEIGGLMKQGAGDIIPITIGCIILRKEKARRYKKDF